MLLTLTALTLSRICKRGKVTSAGFKMNVDVPLTMETTSVVDIFWPSGKSVSNRSKASLI